MRPTYLGFRSPKEKTPDAYNPQVTSSGKPLGFLGKTMSSSFPHSKRFSQYDLEAKRTGFRLGPGTYENPSLDIIKPKRGGPVYKAFHGSKDVTNNGYFYIGDHLVFDPAFVLQSRRSTLINDQSRVEYTKCKRKRPMSAGASRSKSCRKSTASTPSGKRSASVKPKLKSPYELRVGG